MSKPPKTAIIRIQEKSFENNTFQVALSFRYNGNEDEIDITFPNPYDEAIDALFEGYFERYISTPYDTVPYEGTEEKISEYGIQLFKAFFSEGEAYRHYQNIIQDFTAENITIEIVGKTTEFQSIYWESLKETGKKPLAGQGAIFRRKNKGLNSIKAEVLPSPTINLLIVTARPKEGDDVAYRTIQRPLIELIKKSKLKVKAHILRPGTYEAFLRHLDSVGTKHYHIIHFDLHGGLMDYQNYDAYYKRAEKADIHRLLFHNKTFKNNYALTELDKFEGKKAFLFFESRDKGIAVPVEAKQLADVLQENQVPVVILNACQTAKQDSKSDSETSLGRVLIQQGIQLVLAMRYSVSVTAAEVLMKTLYKELYDHGKVEKAIAQARKELYRDKARKAAYNKEIILEDWFLPVVYQNREPTWEIRQFQEDEEEKFILQSRIPTEIMQHLPYGFFGRDLDILKIEKRLLTHRNILLLQGMGGAGKTTLLKYLGTWWLQTGFAEKVFYFGYDQKAYTKTDILTSIAHAIYNEVELAQWRMKKDFVREQNIIDAFQQNSYALTLDNAESITGEKLAIKNTLNSEQRNELQQFLQALYNGNSKIIIGSRSNEKWLEAGTFEKNQLILSGLDAESAKNFADKIIFDLNIPTEYISKDKSFPQLLQLLSGYPLALKAVLPNLKNKTSQQILHELAEGLGGIDANNIQERTESIIKCIEYAHSNLSEDAQKLLLCLAPFVGVVNLTPELIQSYFDELSKNPSFKDYPFDKLNGVVQEAVQNGFMQKAMPDYPMDVMKLQPVFTYFLKNKLQRNKDNIKEILDDAFVRYCSEVGNAFGEFLVSKEPKEQQLGLFLTELEYENLHKALFLQLDKQDSILTLMGPLDIYMSKNQSHQKRLELMEKINQKMQMYEKGKLDGLLGLEFTIVLDTIANAFAASSLLEKAKEIWLEIVEFLNGNDYLKEKEGSGLGAYYHNLGTVSRNQRDYESAKKYYEQALSIFEQYKDIHRQAGVYQNLGIVSKEQRDYESAKKYYEQALSIFEQYKDTYSQAGVYQNLGAVSLNQKDYVFSKAYYEKALSIFEFYENVYSQASVYQSLGIVSKEQKDYVFSKGYYKKALEIYLQYKDIHSSIQILGIASRLPQEANPKPFTQSLLNKTKETFKDNPEILKFLEEEIQEKINKIQ